MPRLNDKQRAVLVFACDNGKISYYEASRLGANGVTLSAMTRKGLLAKYIERGTSHWTATDAGKQLLAA